MTQGKLVGIDVGGTFTDLLLIDEANDRACVAKVPTTENQAHGVLSALQQAGLAPRDVTIIVHGTTTATNAVLERKGAVTGLITTKGFRDVLELGRRTRPKPYGLTGHFEPIIPRELRYEVQERIDAEGSVVVALDEDEVRQATASLQAAGVEAVAIHFINSYANGGHELQARALVGAQWLNRYITTGSELLPEYREYERGMTAAINAYVQPCIDRYLTSLAVELQRQGYRRELLVMQGNGGMMSAAVAAEKPVNALLSGPAAGVKAAASTALAAGYRDVISCDMGGTSFDVAVIRNGAPTLSPDRELGYALPVRIPTIDIHTIGAGGGSIAKVSAAGLLEVGPQSAGARPGPICSNRGGEQPTITDANLLLGRLNPVGLLGVTGIADLDHVRQVFNRELAVHLDMSPEEAASAVIKVANDKMAGLIRMVSLERGHDPRDFALFAFGGAGPLHAVALAKQLAISRVLVPARPGITSALGCLVAEVRHDFVRTVNQELVHMDLARAHAVLADQIAAGRKLLALEEVDPASCSVVHEADMQYIGQSHVITVTIPRTSFDRGELREAFTRAYLDRFGIELPRMECLVVNLRTAVVGHRRSVSLESLAGRFSPTAAITDALLGTRPVWFDGVWIDTPIYRRDRLPRGAEFNGPAVIEQMDATTVIECGDHVHVDAVGNLAIRVGGSPA